MSHLWYSNEDLAIMDDYEPTITGSAARSDRDTPACASGNASRDCFLSALCTIRTLSILSTLPIVAAWPSSAIGGVGRTGMMGGAALKLAAGCSEGAFHGAVFDRFLGFG